MTDDIEKKQQTAGETVSAPAEGQAALQEERPLAAEERREFEEFKRQKKIEEIRRLLRTIDHTMLKQTATSADIRKLCSEAKEYGFYSVCVQPVYVAACREFFARLPAGEDRLRGRLPHGRKPHQDQSVRNKAGGARRRRRDRHGHLHLRRQKRAVRLRRREIKKIVRAAHGRPVKVIIETSLLTRDEMVRAAACARDAGAAFVKTSTGYFGEGARAEDVRLLKETVAGKCQVKASGGIRTAERLKEMVAAGADRIGTSAGKDIAKQLREADEQNGSAHA